jgi:hypothetical protein
MSGRELQDKRKISDTRDFDLSFALPEILTYGGQGHRRMLHVRFSHDL